MGIVNSTCAKTTHSILRIQFIKLDNECAEISFQRFLQVIIFQLVGCDLEASTTSEQRQHRHYII